MKAYRSFIYCAVCLLSLLFCEQLTALAQEEVTLPPGEKPVKVYATFFLVNLNSLNEQNETFDADIYINFKWKDERLKFEGSEEKIYLEDNAAAQLDKIWNPHIEFVNTADVSITNKGLRIAPDGTVTYLLALTSTYRADLDLRKFPFDSQKLTIKIQSFQWQKDEMIFIPEEKKSGFSKENSFEGLYINSIGWKVNEVELSGWDETYSQYDAEIYVSRNYSFYLWTVFAPLVLIFLISCTIFFVSPEHFHDRIGISLTALLACIATQFAINFNLPKIAYMTVIDKSFLITYLCIAIGVLLCVWQISIFNTNSRRAERVSYWARWGVPLIFVVMISWSIYKAMQS